MTKAVAIARRFTLADGVMSIAALGAGAARRYVSYRRTLAELNRLDADALFDLDLTRGTLKTVAWNAAFHN